MNPEIKIKHILCDINMKPKEEIEIYVSDKNNDRIGFIKVHITENNQIVILTDGINNTQSNVFTGIWKGNMPYSQTIKQIEDIYED